MAKEKKKLDPKTLLSISKLISQDSRKGKKRTKKKRNIATQVKTKNNLQNNVSKIGKILKKKNKIKQQKNILNKGNNSNVAAANVKQSNKKKQKTVNVSNKVQLLQNKIELNGTAGCKKKNKKRKYKEKHLLNENNSKGTDNKNIENIQYKNKKNNKLKRLQNKQTFKHDQQDQRTKKKINNSGSEIHVKKDLLKVRSVNTVQKKNSKDSTRSSLRERMQNQLKASHFRYLNEQLYTREGKDAKQFFQSEPDSFAAYHEGFRQQVSKWPMNPLDKIIASVKKMPKDQIIADFGCGEAKLARSVPHEVHSFDLVETVPGVVACDMAHCKLLADSVDVAVYCLSLMGINLRDYLAEANRVLKIGGILKIAEVESRFNRVETFIQGLQSYGFKLTWKDLNHNLFYFLDFKKERNIKNKNKLPTISLQPCLYKKR